MKKSIIYVDGSFTTKNPNTVGWGFITEGGKSKGGKITGEEWVAMRQVSGELAATVKAIEFAIENKIDAVQIRYDYEGVEKWTKGQWKAKTPLTRRYVARIKELAEKIDIYFLKVDAGKNPADKIARTYTGASNCH